MAAESAAAAASSGINAGAMAGVNAASSVLSSVLNYGLNKRLAEQQREWNEQMMDKQNEWSLDMWNKTNEYNAPAAQVQRLKDAGLNPLYFGLDGSSANGLESAQALGYQRAEAPNFDNPAAAGLNAYAQSKSLEKDIELKNAQIDKLEADTQGVRLDNEFKDKTMDARTQAEELKNSLSKEQIKNVQEDRNKIIAECKKLAAETDNESLKGLLIEAQTNVANMQAQEIAELLPYEKLLKEAQTVAQKASAAASFAKAAIDNGLIDAGYIDTMMRKYEADAKDAGARAAINEFKSAVKAGHIYDIGENDSWLTKQGKTFLNAFFNDVSILGEAITGPIAGMFK